MNGTATGGVGRVLGAALAVLLLAQPGAAHAASPCEATPESTAHRPNTRPAAPAGLATDLPAPFTYTPRLQEHAAALRDATGVVERQAAELGVDACYREKPARIASRVEFLSPFEFLVSTVFEHEPARREALLDRYATDPHAAIQGLGEAFPSARGQAVLMTFAYYDIATDRIRVNAARVPPADLRRVLVHEFWHAMPSSRTWTEPGGPTRRAHGFWLQELHTGGKVWMPVEDRRGLPYASYLLDEAMATLMETRYAGPSRYARPELLEVQQYLDRLMSVAGSTDVLREYLGSRPYSLAVLTEAHRSSFPELEIAAGP